MIDWSLSGILGQMIAGVFLVQYGRWTQRRSDRKRPHLHQEKVYPYSWKCPYGTCIYKISGTNKDTVDKAKISHIQSGHVWVKP